MEKQERKHDIEVEPWRRNPSRWDQRVPICILATIGAIIATYLALYQLRLIETVWDPVFGDGTAKVLDSGVSETMKSWFHIPDAAFGAIAYLGDAIFGLAGGTMRWKHRPWLVVLFGIDVIPLGVVSIILMVMQGAVVGYWCFLCLVTAAISLVLIILAYDEVWSCLLLLGRVYKTSNHNKKLLWQTFWGIPSREVEEIANKMVRLKDVA
jgi:uncharacterized membrane protein